MLLISGQEMAKQTSPGLREIAFYEGAGSRIRTDDLLITNQLLYQLSYAGIYEGKPSILIHFFRPLYPLFVSLSSKMGTMCGFVPLPLRTVRIPSEEASPFIRLVRLRTLIDGEGAVRANASLKPRSKDYREMTLDFIRRSWPALFETDVRKVSERDCENWLTRFQQQYAPTVVNNSIGTLRAVFDEAIGTGARFNNPAAALSCVKVRQKRLNLPSRGEFL